MPTKLPITNQERAQRHVLSQQLYRLRKEYRFFLDADLQYSAGAVLLDIQRLEKQYDILGGRPRHVGNVVLGGDFENE